MDFSKFPSQAPTRKTWQGMMNRCYTSTNKDYPSCGGAGIVVCDRWHTYENFLADMGEKPVDALLARYVPTGDFTPDNTYWQPKVHTRTNRLYGIWKGIKRRCGFLGPSTGSRDYLARGVTMDADWVSSFAAFASDVGEPPSTEHQLDRIDNNGGYVPGNVRWVLAKENGNNRSDNVYIEMLGKRQTLQQWCEEFGVARTTVAARWRTLFDQPKTPGVKGYRCSQVDPVTGGTIAEFENSKFAAEATGIRRATIQKCLSGGNATAGGFAWRYLD